MASIIVILLSEISKISILIAVIIAAALFLLLVLILFSYYLRQISEKIEMIDRKANQIKKDLNVDNRLVRLEKDTEWIKKRIN